MFFIFLSLLRDISALAPRIAACCAWCGEGVASPQVSEGLDYRSRQAVRLTCRSMSSALVPVVEIKLKGMDWPTQQSFHGKTILTFVKTRVCSVVYSLALYLGSELPQPGQI
jgi:hypothetical protein